MTGKATSTICFGVVITAVDTAQIPRAQYGAVLIDEGHDFETDRLRLAVQMLDPATNSLLLLYDDAQSLYGATSLDAAGVPVEWLRDARSKRFSGERDSVKLMTYKSSKGLQFPLVVVAGVGTLPWRDPAGEARELYVAMTRATERLLITASRTSEFVRRLQPLCMPLSMTGP